KARPRLGWIDAAGAGGRISPAPPDRSARHAGRQLCQYRRGAAAADGNWRLTTSPGRAARQAPTGGACNSLPFFPARPKRPDGVRWALETSQLNGRIMELWFTLHRTGWSKG